MQSNFILDEIEVLHILFCTIWNCQSGQCVLYCSCGNSQNKNNMKKKLLSVILTAAMLLTLASTLGVAVVAEEPTQSGTVYEVTDAASITALIADTEKNVFGNTMKLTQDLIYGGTESGDGHWQGLKMNVDGNGHKITLQNGNYSRKVLFYAPSGTAKDWATQSIKNLAVVMENEDAWATANSTGNQYIALFGGCDGYLNKIVENCYFDVNFKTAGDTVNDGTSILIARVTENKDFSLRKKLLPLTFCKKEKAEPFDYISVGKRFQPLLISQSNIVKEFRLTLRQRFCFQCVILINQYLPLKVLKLLRSKYLSLLGTNSNP